LRAIIGGTRYDEYCCYHYDQANETCAPFVDVLQDDIPVADAGNEDDDPDGLRTDKHDDDFTALLVWIVVHKYKLYSTSFRYITTIKARYDQYHNIIICKIRS